MSSAQKMSDALADSADFRALIDVEPMVQSIHGRDGGCSMLIYGREGVGKRLTVLALIQRLLCERSNACGSCRSCRECIGGVHPEVLSFDDEESFTVEAAQELQDHLTYQAQRRSGDGQRWRIAIVHNAERMTVAAANRLLKTLEEPPSESLLILVSAHPQRLPVTVRSRLIKFRVKPPPIERMTGWLQSCVNQDGLKFSPAEIASRLRLHSYAPISTLKSLRSGVEANPRNWDEFFGATVPQVVLQLAESWARSDKRTITQWVCEVELELNRCYRQYYGIESTPAGAGPWLSADTVSRIRRRLRQVRRLGVGSKIALNAQMFLESIGLAKFESPMEQ